MALSLFQQNLTTAYHPQANGIAERMNAFDETYLYRRLQRFLFVYRNTLQRPTNRSPNELIFGRPLRCIFDQLKPDIKRSVHKEIFNQVKINNPEAKKRVFYEKYLVFS